MKLWNLTKMNKLKWYIQVKEEEVITNKDEGKWRCFPDFWNAKPSANEESLSFCCKLYFKLEVTIIFFLHGFYNCIYELYNPYCKLWIIVIVHCSDCGIL